MINTAITFAPKGWNAILVVVIYAENRPGLVHFISNPW